MSAFSEWLASAMETRGLGDRALGRMLGVSYTTVRLWRVGATTPTYPNCTKIARALNVRPETVTELCGYEIPPAYPDQIDPDLDLIIRTWHDAGAAGRAALLAVARSISGGERAAQEQGA